MATKMTREEKAKAYDEALKKAREIKEKIMFSHLSTESCKAVSEYIDTIIPELTESKDEKIRKELVAFFKAMQDSPWHEEYWHDLEIVRILAYLEKQKDEEGYEEIPVESTLEYKLGFKAGKDSEKQKEQKPVPPLPPFDEMTPEEKMNHPLYLEGFDTGRDVQKVFDEQKPAEWSEEDEKDMAHIIRILDDCYVYGTHDLSKTDHENLVNKLKSLRPSWKPSEEQMRALNEIVNILAESPFLHQNDYLFNILNGLREELKKPL